MCSAIRWPKYLNADAVAQKQPRDYFSDLNDSGGSRTRRRAASPKAIRPAARQAARISHSYKLQPHFGRHVREDLAVARTTENYSGEDPTNDDDTGGHLEVVQWLHAHRSEGCTTYAMDSAATEGHLATLQWLHANRNEGCTTSAMQLAAVNGHFAVLLFLHVHCSEGCAADTIRFSDTCVAHMEIVQWLSEKYPDAVDVLQITRRDYYMTAVLDHILWQTFADDDG